MSHPDLLIVHHMEARACADETLGHRAKERLRESEHFDDLMRLSELDRAGRKRGVDLCTVAEALAYVRELDAD